MAVREYLYQVKSIGKYINKENVMKLILTKKPKSPTMIYGFPSVGLVSTITTKFLIEHLEVEEIGCIESKYLLPLTAIHKSNIVEPITLYYNKKYNLVILQSLTEVAGLEWEIADAILNIAKLIDVSAARIDITSKSATPACRVFLPETNQPRVGHQ